jgi:chromosomal replication initiation ATPase DnaA
LLLSKNRTEKVSNARHVLIGLLRKHTDLSLQQIGLYVGNRSHSTVLSSLKKINSGEGLFIKEPDILDIEGKESQAS